MKYNKRRTKILELLDINEKMSYTQLAESLDVSQATIRRDLVFLEKEHAIEPVSYTHLDRLSDQRGKELFLFHPEMPTELPWNWRSLFVCGDGRPDAWDEPG